MPTRPPARKATSRRKPAAARSAVRKATRGQRPWQAGLVILLFVLGSMAWAPLKNLSAGSQRIDHLTASRDRLTEEVDKLDARKEQLMDPQQLELIAREEYGLVKPGEIPYVVVTPETEPQLGPGEDQSPAVETSWYERAWSAIRRLWN